MNLLYKVSALTLGLGVLGATTPAFANPDIATVVRSGQISLQSCVTGAKKGADKLNFENIKADSDSVSGDYQEYSVLILCNPIKGTEVMTQTIIVAGPPNSKTAAIRQQIKQAIDE